MSLPSDQRVVNERFNVKAFANAPATSLGNAGVGIIEGPNWQNWDASLRKIFQIRERLYLHFTADVFEPHFGNPDVTTSNSSFGQISSSQPARNIQFGARLTFKPQIELFDVIGVHL